MPSSIRQHRPTCLGIPLHEGVVHHPHASASLGKRLQWRGRSKLTLPIVQEALAAFDCIVPGILSSKIEAVDAGIICSWEESDISDPESELHERFDVGVQSYDGYYWIDTGKFTCAPFFAQQFLNAIR